MKVRKIDSLAGASSLEVTTPEGVTSHREWVCPSGTDRASLGDAELKTQCRPVMLVSLGSVKKYDRSPGAEALRARARARAALWETGHPSGAEEHVGKFERDWTPEDRKRANAYYARVEREWEEAGGDDRLGDDMGVDYPEDFEKPRRGWQGVGSAQLEDDVLNVTCRRVRRRGEDRVLCETTDGGTTLRGLLRARRQARARVKKRRKRR